MFIRSKDTANPVLLYVRGGPAFPNYFLIEKFKPGLEDYFTVCYWEQHGGGIISFYKSGTRDQCMIDFASTITELNIPVCFFSGKYDLTVNIDLSKAYHEKLQAPLKGFYTFNNSAHSPLFEEPRQVRQIIETDILNGTNTLAENDEVTSLKRGREK